MRIVFRWLWLRLFVLWAFFCISIFIIVCMWPYLFYSTSVSHCDVSIILVRTSTWNVLCWLAILSDHIFLFVSRNVVSSVDLLIDIVILFANQTGCFERNICKAFSIYSVRLKSSSYRILMSYVVAMILRLGGWIGICGFRRLHLQSIVLKCLVLFFW